MINDQIEEFLADNAKHRLDYVKEVLRVLYEIADEYEQEHRELTGVSYRKQG